MAPPIAAPADLHTQVVSGQKTPRTRGPPTITTTAITTNKMPWPCSNPNAAPVLGQCTRLKYDSTSEGRIAAAKGMFFLDQTLRPLIHDDHNDGDDRHDEPLQ